MNLGGLSKNKDISSGQQADSKIPALRMGGLGGLGKAPEASNNDNKPKIGGLGLGLGLDLSKA